MNAQIPSFNLNQFEKAQPKVITLAQHKSSGKTTFVLNFASKLIAEGKKLLIVDLDPIRAAEDFYKLNESNVKARIENLTKLVSESLNDNRLGDVKRYTNSISAWNKKTTLNIYGSSLSAFSLKTVKNTHPDFDYILIDIPANLYTSADEIKPEISQLFIDSDLVIFPVKAEPQELKTAPKLGNYVANLTQFCKSKGIHVNTKFRSMLCFESAKYRGDKGLVKITETIVGFARTFHNTIPPILAPMVFRSLYPNKISEARSIYSSESVEAKTAQQEFDAVAQQIINTLN
ncbi:MULTISPECIES: ParA family protein [Pseudomonas syringae group]|uniref:ParA family protein n=1 Tax=Pseudomonas syringae group TaxID=136849 RepID=UPI0009B01CDF|nr:MULTISPECIES: ParA family protein [Pseudomonas syringae group]ARA80366.1 hypothetical protein B5U27_09990 [Pseudomonas amygdali pv. lachrymans]MCK9715175.1 AAA family ATPase [Pseudomonas syringae pv. syringae]MCK9764278.1 AAA family ATPase [Pseudomonas syringae pv. syringae]